MRGVLLTALVLLLLVAAFASQNRQDVSVTLLFWTRSTTLALAMIASAILGAMLVYIASLLSHRGLRARLHAAERRLAEAERERTVQSSTEGTRRV